MSTLSGTMRTFWKQDSGLETVEYAVMTAMIAASIIGALGALILTINDLFGLVADAM